MEDDVMDFILTLITISAIIMFLSVFVIDYINLEKFKSCYDINFQDIKCQKYLNY